MFDENTMFNLQSTADWRAEKAEEYPDDRRNSEAVRILRRLATDFEEGRIDRSLMAKYDEYQGFLDENQSLRASEFESETRRQIGFWHDFPDGNAYLAYVLDGLADILAEEREGD